MHAVRILNVLQQVRLLMSGTFKHTNHFGMVAFDFKRIMENGQNNLKNGGHRTTVKSPGEILGTDQKIPGDFLVISLNAGKIHL